MKKKKLTIKTEKGRVFSGVVVSDKMRKTVAVEVKRFFRHPKYGKYVLRTKRLLAHDEEGKCRAGDAVKIREGRPLSRRKSFVVI